MNRAVVLLATLVLSAAACSSELDQKLEALVAAKERWQSWCPGETYTLSYQRKGGHWGGITDVTVKVKNAQAVDAPPPSADLPQLKNLTVRDMFNLILESYKPENNFAVDIEYEPTSGVPKRLVVKMKPYGAEFVVTDIVGCGKAHAPS